jgi:hypothetical protein
VDLLFPPVFVGPAWLPIGFKIQSGERTTAGASKMGSMQGSEYGELWCSEAPKGAAGQDPGSVNLEGLTEKVGSQVFPET